jgi:dTDP-4-dehydrorhamnose 3,5-epimerase
MGKLVRTIQGRAIDLILDIRSGSPTFGQAIAVDLPAKPDGDSNEWVWIPPGFAHGNLFTEPTTIEYFCSGQYSPGCEAGISPLASDIDWSLCDPKLKSIFDEFASSKAILTEKDRNGLSLGSWANREEARHFVYGRC